MSVKAGDEPGTAGFTQTPWQPRCHLTVDHLCNDFTPQSLNKGPQQLLLINRVLHHICEGIKHGKERRERWESRPFSLQPTVMLCKNVTVAPETGLCILEVETGIFLKCTVSLLACFFAPLPSHNNLLFPPLGRLLVFGRPVPGAGEALRGCCGEALGQAAGPRHHRRLQGAKARQPPPGLAHTLQWKGYGTTFLVEGLAGMVHALCVCGYMEIVSFPPDIKGHYPWNVSILAWGCQEICQEFLL